jgi:hypothetical protein
MTEPSPATPQDLSGPANKEVVGYKDHIVCVKWPINNLSLSDGDFSSGLSDNPPKTEYPLHSDLSGNCALYSTA